MYPVQPSQGASYPAPSQNEDNNAALLKAAKSGDEANLRHLLSLPGININAQDKLGWTALLLAAEKGHKAIVELLLAQDGINVNAKECNDKTALMLAASRGHIEIVEALLGVDGIKIHALDRHYHSTALLWAAQNGHTETVKALLNHEGRIHKSLFHKDLLMEAAVVGQVNVVETLIAAGINHWTMKVVKNGVPQTLLGMELSDQTVRMIRAYANSDQTVRVIRAYANNTLSENQELLFFVVVINNEVIEVLESYRPTPSEEEKADLMRFQELPFCDSLIPSEEEKADLMRLRELPFYDSAVLV